MIFALNSRYQKWR